MSDRDDFVEVEFDRLVKLSPSGKAFLLEIEGDEYWVAKSQVDNADDLEEDLEKPAHKREEDTILVPKWLAQENGWVDD